MNKTIEYIEGIEKLFISHAQNSQWHREYNHTTYQIQATCHAVRYWNKM